MKIYEAIQSNSSGTDSIKLFLKETDAKQFIERWAFEENNYYMNPQDGESFPKEYEYKKIEINGAVFWKNCIDTLIVRTLEVE